MRKPEEELKARLLAEIEAEVEALLAETGERGQMTLTDIDRFLAKQGSEFSSG